MDVSLCVVCFFSMYVYLTRCNNVFSCHIVVVAVSIGTFGSNESFETLRIRLQVTLTCNYWSRTIFYADKVFLTI